MNINDIRKISEAQQDNWSIKFEKMISTYYEKRGASSIPDLISLFSDEMPSEINFSIIHLIEQTNVKAYIQNFLKIFKNRILSDHEWLDILLFRIMNDDRYYNELQSQASNMGRVEKDNFNELLSRMINNPDNVDFIDKLHSLQKDN